MSRLYWHTPTRTVELLGAEFHHLRHVAEEPGTAAWGLDGPDAFDRATALLALTREPPPGRFGENYLYVYLRRAQAAGDPAAVREFLDALRTTLRVESIPLDVAGVRLGTASLELNTTLEAGPDTLRVAAKLGHWGEQHCWVEGPDRKWLADLIDQALADGLFRRGLWYLDGLSGIPAEQHPDRKWSDLGWDGVLELLRERDDEPVVLSYSVTSGFPNQDIADWTPPTLPADWAPSWANDDQGRAEWAAMDDEEQAELRSETAGEAWSEVPDVEQWRLAMEGLRTTQPWARLAADTLAEYWFGLPLTVADVLAPDRDDRVRAAAAQ